jgi:hypothetical protein
MRFLLKACLGATLAVLCLAAFWASGARAATVGDEPAEKGLKSADKPDSAPLPPEKKDDEKEKGKGGSPSGTLDTKKPRPTTIRDALTIDPNLYGVDFSKAKLGEADDIVTRQALKDSARISIDAEATEEQEQIKEDQHATRFTAAVGKAEEKAVDEAKEREEKRAEDAERTKQQRPWLLIGAGVAVSLALLVFVIALRKMRDYE